MTSADSRRVDPGFLANAMASFIQIGAVLILILWCFSIIKPFLGVVIWGVIISIALYPAHVSLSAKVGGSEKLSATILVLLGLAIIIVPTWMLADSTIEGLQYVSGELEDGSVHIPPPNDSVAEWPIIGERVHAVWAGAANNLAETLNKFEPQLRSMGQTAVGVAGGIVGGAFQFIFATIIGGVLLTTAVASYGASRNIANSLVGNEGGTKLIDMSILTIRSVVKGVLGVAVIQTIFAAIGLVAIGMPAAGLFAGAVLVLAIVQLPPIIILGPIAIWYFSVADGMPATIFLVYAFIVSMSDAFLKPMLLGRGVDTPMLVILIGAIGGAITEGIVGLFVGAVVLALGYELFTAWMAPDEPEEAPAEA
jgi:predicted PurR-regulated permease PerM